MSGFSNEEIQRYSRHLLMPEVGLAGQQRLKDARVLCVGAGGLGSPLALYLAAAGIGTLGLVEFDAVDATNLQRQVLYSTADIGRPKLDAACERLRALNPEITVVPHATRLDASNVMALVAGYDIVADGSDNFPTRYLVNDACALAGKPDVHASIFRFEGQLSVFDARSGPCYRCLFRDPPPPGEVPSCAEGGVLGVLPGILGTLQALEVIKLVLGHGEPLRGRLLVFDGLAGESHTVRLRKDPACPLCGDAPTIRAPVEPAAYCTPPMPTDSRDVALVAVEALAARRAAGETPELIDVRDAQEFALVHIAGARLLPLAELAQRIDELDPARHYVLCCHKGPRSLRAAQLLRAAGFGSISVLEGGVDAWAARVEPALPRY